MCHGADTVHSWKERNGTRQSPGLKYTHAHSVWLAEKESVCKLGERERKTGSQAVSTQTTPLGLQLSLHGYGGAES